MYIYIYIFNVESTLCLKSMLLFMMLIYFIIIKKRKIIFLLLQLYCLRSIETMEPTFFLYIYIYYFIYYLI